MRLSTVRGGWPEPAPHPESEQVAEQGLVAYRDALPVESMDLVAEAAGVRVAWRDGEGWSTEGEP